MGGFFGVVSKHDAISDTFFGTDYHSHLGTRRGGMAAYRKEASDKVLAKDQKISEQYSTK